MQPYYVFIFFSFALHTSAEMKSAPGFLALAVDKRINILFEEKVRAPSASSFIYESASSTVIRGAGAESLRQVHAVVVWLGLFVESSFIATRVTNHGFSSLL